MKGREKDFTVKMPTSNIGRKRKNWKPFMRFRTSTLIILVLGFASLSGFVILFSLWMLPESSTFLSQTGIASRLQRKDWCSALKKRSPLVCAHGGDVSHAPPNTMEAYRYALQESVDCVEVDASRTLDGHLVALHDRDLQLFSNNSKVRVGDLTLEEIRDFDANAGLRFDIPRQEVLLLEQALMFLAPQVKQVTVDIKVGPPFFANDLAREVIGVVERTRCGNCLLWSKEDVVVEELKEIEPLIKVGYIVMKNFKTGRVDPLLRLPAAEVVGIHFQLTKRAIVEQLKRNNKEVQVWTVDSKEDMIQMIRLGVNCVVTNKPALLQNIIMEQVASCEEQVK